MDRFTTDHLVVEKGQADGLSIGSHGAPDKAAAGRAHRPLGVGRFDNQHWFALMVLEMNTGAEGGDSPALDERLHPERIADRPMPGAGAGHPLVVFHTDQEHPAPAVGEADDGLYQIPVRQRPSLFPLELDSKRLTILNELP
jgi:hypothetical protein